MGFWNINARDLRVGDEVRVRVMGGEEFLTVLDREDAIGPNVRVKLEYGLHVPVEPFWDTLPADEQLTVRR